MCAMCMCVCEKTRRVGREDLLISAYSVCLYSVNTLAVVSVYASGWAGMCYISRSLIRMLRLLAVKSPWPGVVCNHQDLHTEQSSDWWGLCGSNWHNYANTHTRTRARSSEALSQLISNLMRFIQTQSRPPLTRKLHPLLIVHRVVWHLAPRTESRWHETMNIKQAQKAPFTEEMFLNRLMTTTFVQNPERH